jgi:hypothetical protein
MGEKSLSNFQREYVNLILEVRHFGSFVVSELTFELGEKISSTEVELVLVLRMLNSWSCKKAVSR